VIFCATMSDHRTEERSAHGRTPRFDGCGKAGFSLLAALAGIFAVSRFLNYHPPDVQSVLPVNRLGAPNLQDDGPIKIITYNTQFFAGTSYHFFYDGGQDTIAVAADIRRTVQAVSEFVTGENPDFIFLQEVDSGARRTGYLNQTELLFHSFREEFRNYAEAFYWKSRFVPHPKIVGSVGTKLVIFSRYRIGRVARYQLPCTPSNPVVKDFNFKRAILQVEIPLANGKDLYLLNTHLEAFPGKTDIMKRQVDCLLERLHSIDQQNAPWILGGDFNLLPPGQLALLGLEGRGCHREPSEISALYDRYSGVPTLSDASGEKLRSFMTFTKRSGRERVPARTLDYFFASSQIKVRRYNIVQDEVRYLSDHLPLVAEFEFRS
jgi:endonuclease/exonuclease/phosphatase family metal-dependent hydrolase